jgi:alpha-amylase
VSEGRVSFLFGIHNHQPAGNFEDVMREAVARAYQPFLERLAAFPGVRLTAHCTGTLLEFLRERAPRTFDLLGALAARGQVELLTGGFYEPILPVLPDHDKVGQIQHLSEFLKSHFGVRPRGMWLAERVWEPHLPRAIAEAGVEFVLVDDRHFALTGLDPAALTGYYLTEEQGARLAVFPISERLRYLVPFAEPAVTLDYLRSWRGPGAGLTLVDDGEKFGLWPGTYAHVYEHGWLTRFFEALAGADWLETPTFSDFLDAYPPTGTVYLPAASYSEMGEWALPTAAGLAREDVRRRLEALPDGGALAGWLRGGFWRTFLVKYPEVGDLYWKMLRLSLAIRDARVRRPDDPRLRDAQRALWRGQANDAYWHGVFGGCYLPHLRRAVKSALLDAERLEMAAAADTGVSCRREDLNGDGRPEVLVRTPELTVTVQPERGGTVTELGFLPRTLDVADVFTRRPEVYHTRMPETSVLAYDRYRRASLLDGLFPAGEPLDPVEPWAAARAALGEARLASRVETEGERARVVMAAERPAGHPVAITKTLEVRGAAVAVEYRLRWLADEPLDGRWAVQWNLALTAGDAFGRYFRLPGHPGLASRGAAADLAALALVDEWAGVELDLAWSRPGDAGWGPIETVSISEGGFERLYQGTAVLLAWPVRLDRDREWDVRLTLTLTAREPAR